MMSERTCTVPNCTKAHRAKGLCAKHYMRLYNTGTIELRNRREYNGLLVLGDRALTIKQWAVELGISYRALVRRLNKWPETLALTTPRRKWAQRVSADRTSKQCSHCHTTKSVGLFYVRRGYRGDGYQSHCIQCSKQLSTERQRKDPERAASYVRKHLAMKAAKYKDLCNNGAGPRSTDDD